MPETTPKPASSGDGPSDTDVDLVQQLLDETRQRWQRGEKVLVEDYLARYPNLTANPEGVVDLIYGEVLVREQAGEAIAIDDYLKRFPQYKVALQRQFALHKAIVEEASSLS